MEETDVSTTYIAIVGHTCKLRDPGKLQIVMRETAISWPDVRLTDASTRGAINRLFKIESEFM